MSPTPIRLTMLPAALAVACAAMLAATPAPAAEPTVQQIVITGKRLPKAEAPPVQRVIIIGKRLPRAQPGEAVARPGSGASGTTALRPTAAPAR